MILTIIIAFFTLVALIIIHEFGHFILAKKLGVKVEEFGLGYPPRIFGKKIGETIYSLNALPFGGFVRIYGQEEKIDHPKSFSNKVFWKKSLIILGGVISFWIVSALILIFIMLIGVPSAIGDQETENIIDPKIQIMGVAKNSPAEQAGLKVGDILRDFDKASEVMEFSYFWAGKEVALEVQRGKEVFDVFLTPRVSCPDQEGPMGLSLSRTALRRYPLHIAVVKGISSVGSLTWLIIKSWIMVFGSIFSGKGLPSGVEVGGPIKIFELFIQIGGLGATYFLQFIAVIAVHLALINILPIPALDGGWFMFMVIEKLRGRPLNQKVVQKISAVFFFLLLALMVWITIRDIIHLV